MIQDALGRTAVKLRLSVTESCNFNCPYCRPQGCQASEKQQSLPPVEMLRLASILTKAGIREIRVTGGEPTLRPDLMDILHGLSTLPLAKLSMTTNASRLMPLLEPLLATRCMALNISLDTLRRDRFVRITGRDAFKEVYASILTAKAMGFAVKVNTVVLKGINQDELLDFAVFSAEHGIEVRFLEYMQVTGGPFPGRDYFMPADEIMACLAREFDFSEVPVPADSTARRYISASGAAIGLIAGESRPFCGSCSRLRLNAGGTLLPCLCSEEGLSLRDLPDNEVTRLVQLAFIKKPRLRVRGRFQPLYQIGG